MHHTTEYGIGYYVPNQGPSLDEEFPPVRRTIQPGISFRSIYEAKAYLKEYEALYTARNPLTRELSDEDKEQAIVFYIETFTCFGPDSGLRD